MSLDFSRFSEEEILSFHQRVGANVRAIREAKQLTQLNVALEIDIKSVAFFSNCENNRYDKHFNLEHLYKLSKVMDVPIEDFFKQIPHSN